MKDNGRVGKPGVNYYSLLGVSSTASPDDITKAFRKKILQVHLDKMGPEDDTELCYLTIEAHRILSDKALRAKYDVERTASKDYKSHEEEFIPAGYICYDVGNQQMSRQLLDNISKWTKEYEQSGEDFKDNYFPCFSQIMDHVICDDERNSCNKSSLGLEGKNGGKEAHYYCNVCDKIYMTEAHHSDVVIKPYRGMFFSDERGIAALKGYFESLVGSKACNLERRYLPYKPLGIWGLKEEWERFEEVKGETVKILKKLGYLAEKQKSKNNDAVGDGMSCFLEKLESFLEDLEEEEEDDEEESERCGESSGCSDQMRICLVQNLICCCRNADCWDNEMVGMRMSDSLIQDDVQEIMCLGVAMKYIFGFQFSDWEQLGQVALAEGEFELAMIWNMVAVLCGDKSKEDWFHLGMTIRGSGDAVLSHFCFLLAGYDGPGKWEGLADIFTQNGDHFAAVDYHIISGKPLKLLSKSNEFKRVDLEASQIYGEIFNAIRIKGILHHLQETQKECENEFILSEECTEDIEELIEIIRELNGDILQGCRIIVSTWSNVLEEEDLGGLEIHRSMIEYLRKGAINLKCQKLILAAAHFLPGMEMQFEIMRVTEESSKLVRQMLEMAQETNDFETLTDVLINLNKRTLNTAEKYLEEISETPKESEAQSQSLNEEENPSASNVKPPGFKSAIQYLISGSICKVKEAWMDAMTHYQNALLSAPEVMHRVLPCVSKLVQDIQFHEAVVSQVSQEVHDLQGHLRRNQYPDIDEFSSDKRRSLIFTDVSPKADYGYKDNMSKMQPDPDKIPAPPPTEEELPEQPPPPANTPQVTLDKNSEAIQTGQQDGQIDQLNAALAYVDLLKALPLQMHPGPLTMAASHFLLAMDGNKKDESPVELGKLYAYRNAIMLMAENLLKVDNKFQHTIHHGLTHKHMLSILLGAHEKLSKAIKISKDPKKDVENSLVDLFTMWGDNEKDDRNGDKDIVNKKEEDDEEEEEEDDDDDDNDQETLNFRISNKKDLINKSEARVIAKFFQNVVKFPKVEPLASIPTLNCSDLVYVEAMGNSFLSQFCSDKVRQKHQSPMIPKHLHAYTHFIEVWKGRSTLSNFPQARLKAMEELVALKGWTMGDIQRNMISPVITYQEDGFSPQMQCLLELRDPLKSYRTVEGFHIDYIRGNVELIFGRESFNPSDTLFDLYDVKDVVSLMGKGSLNKLIFNLETPEGGSLSLHPFKEAKVSSSMVNCSNSTEKVNWNKIPEYIRGTISRVSMLLGYFASGYELCSETPFWLRNNCEGLITRLEDHLQHFARPISWRRSEQNENNKHSGDNETVGKFWLNLVEVFEEIEEDEEGDDEEEDIDSDLMIAVRKLNYRIGEIRTEVRPNTLVMTLNPRNNQQGLNPEGEFAKDLTKHFREFSRNFPELQRLEELVKIGVVCEKLRQVLIENKNLIRELEKEEKSHLKNGKRPSTPVANGIAMKSTSSSCNTVNCLSKVCSLIENFLGLEEKKGEECSDRNLSDDFDSRRSQCDWFPAGFCHNLSPDVYDVTFGIEMDPVVTYGPVPSHSKPIKVSLPNISSLMMRNIRNCSKDGAKKAVFNEESENNANATASVTISQVIGNVRQEGEEDNSQEDVEEDNSSEEEDNENPSLKSCSSNQDEASMMEEEDEENEVDSDQEKAVADRKEGESIEGDDDDEDGDPSYEKSEDEADEFSSYEEIEEDEEEAGSVLLEKDENGKESLLQEEEEMKNAKGDRDRDADKVLVKKDEKNKMNLENNNNSDKEGVTNRLKLKDVDVDMALTREDEEISLLSMNNDNNNRNWRNGNGKNSSKMTNKLPLALSPNPDQKDCGEVIDTDYKDGDDVDVDGDVVVKKEKPFINVKEKESLVE